MNFEFWKEQKSLNESLQSRYDTIAVLLDEAENCYWESPAKCAKLLQKAANEICFIYNQYFELEFVKEASLSEMLCYSGEEEHDRKVSKFLCAVSDQQRNQLNLLRVLGEESTFLEANPSHRDAQNDKLYLNAKKMMIAMMDCLKHLLKIVEKRNDVEELEFDESELPNEPPCEEIPPKPSFWKKWKKK